jgi:ribonuclease HI
MEKPDYTLTFDGGSLGNPGPGYGSYFLVRNRDGKSRTQRLDFQEEMTSNQAEYRTLIAGLEDLVSTIRKAGRSPQKFSLEVRGDSRLILYQVARRWKTKKPHLMPLRDKVEALLEGFGSITLIWQRRDKSERVLGH